MFWLKHFAVSSGVRGNLSPTTIITGRTIDFPAHFKLYFGAYAQVHEYTQPRNLGEARTLGAVSLGPSDNMQGEYKFFSLATVEIFHRFSCTELPMPNAVIHRVEQLSMIDQQPVALDFKLVLGVEVVDLPPNPDNEVYDETRALDVERLASKDTGQQMEDASNYDYPRNTEEADCIYKVNNKLNSTDGIVPDTE